MSAPAAALLEPEVDQLLTALADRTRRRILVRLAERPDDAGAVARDLDLTRQGVAKHLAVLEEAGLVGAERRARRRVHTVAPQRLHDGSALLELVARGWEDRLQTIKRLAEQAETAERAEQRDPDAG